MRRRIPGWCSDPEISVNGNPTATLPPVLDGYITIDRHWLDGDIVQLALPMRVTAISRDYGAAGLRLGPLVLALGIGENWCPVAGARTRPMGDSSPEILELRALARKPRRYQRIAGRRTKVGPVQFALESAPIHVVAKGAVATAARDCG